MRDTTNTRRKNRGGLRKKSLSSEKTVSYTCVLPPKKAYKNKAPPSQNVDTDLGIMYAMENVEVDNENNRENVKDWSEWIAATNTKNFLMDDGFLDVLQHQSASVIKASSVYAKEISRMISSVNDTKGFVPSLLTFGNIFENKIVNLLKEKVGEENTVNIGGNNNARSFEKYENTVKAIKRGIPIIFEAVLRNYDNKTYGVSDLLVRSDWVNKFLSVPALYDEEVNIKASNLKKGYHYVVIDIKYKTLPLRADGVHLRNDSNMKAYKSQLLIYNEALGNIQGYTPPYAFILGSKWKYTSRGNTYEGDCALGRLGRIDYKDLDKEYISKTKDAISWLRDVRTSNYDLSKYPLERDELYPNMCNRHDYPYHKIKKMYAEANKDLTLIWNVGPKQRRIANSKGIYRWDDKRCNSKALGVGGEIKSKVINRILEANHLEDENTIIIPEIIEGNSNDWKNLEKRKVELYVDFEMTCSVFSDLEDLPFNDGASLIFLIGAGYICPIDGKWKFKYFVANETTESEEERICLELVSYIRKLAEHYKITSSIPCWHYSHAEKSSWNRFIQRTGIYAHIDWRDMLKVFLSEPVGIKGALSYSLKTIAKTFYENKLIKTCYDDNLGCADGSDAAVGAYRANIECRNKKIKLSQHSLIKDIIKYNEVDCKVLQEIMQYLRQNHSTGIPKMIYVSNNRDKNAKINEPSKTKTSPKTKKEAPPKTKREAPPKTKKEAPPIAKPSQKTKKEEPLKTKKEEPVTGHSYNLRKRKERS